MNYFSEDNPLYQLAVLAMTPDDEKAAFLAEHPDLVATEVAGAALKTAEIRGMTGDAEGQFQYASAALFIATELSDRSLGVHACRLCVSAAETTGNAEAAEFFIEFAKTIANS